MAPHFAIEGQQAVYDQLLRALKGAHCRRRSAIKLNVVVARGVAGCPGIISYDYIPMRGAPPKEIPCIAVRLQNQPGGLSGPATRMTDTSGVGWSKANTPSRIPSCRLSSAGVSISKIITDPNADFALSVKKLADSYGEALTRDQKGQRRTIAPVPSADEDKELCEIAYGNRGGAGDVDC